MLASYDETADFKLYRIRAYESIEYIEEQINAVVKKIREIIDSKKIKVWNINREQFSVVIEKGILDLLRAGMLLEEMYIALLAFLNNQKMSLHIKRSVYRRIAQKVEI